MTTILLLIPDKQLSDIYAKRLKTVGWEVAVVKTVAQAKKELKKREIHAMIVDGQMEDSEVFAVPTLWLVDSLNRSRIESASKNARLKIVRKQDLVPSSLIKFIRSML